MDLADKLAHGHDVAKKVTLLYQKRMKIAQLMIARHTLRAIAG